MDDLDVYQARLGLLEVCVVMCCLIGTLHRVV